MCNERRLLTTLTLHFERERQRKRERERERGTHPRGLVLCQAHGWKDWKQ